MTGYLKTFDQALLEMARDLIADLGVQVDLVGGSSIDRSLLEAVAFQVADLSERQESSILEAIPEAVYAAFGFDLLQARPSAGSLLFRAPLPVRTPLLIPEGTEVASDDEQSFITVSDAVMLPNTRDITAPAVAVEPGSSGNIPAFSIVRLITGVSGIQSVTNPAPFRGGADQETPAAQLARFLEHLAALDRSNVVALALAARTATDGTITPRNVFVLDGKLDSRISPGRFQVHLYRRGGIPSGLQAAVEVQVDQVRSGGCIPTFAQTIGRPVTVSALLTVSAPGALPVAEQALGAYFDGLRYGQKASRENIIAVLKNAHPNILEADVALPVGDVLANLTDRLELGTLTLNEQVNAEW